MIPTTIFPDQADALAELLRQPRAVAADVSAAEHMSVRVAIYFAAPEGGLDAVTDARWYTVSIAGTVREIMPTPANT